MVVPFFITFLGVCEHAHHVHGHMGLQLISVCIQRSLINVIIPSFVQGAIRLILKKDYFDLNVRYFY